MLRKVGSAVSAAAVYEHGLSPTLCILENLETSRDVEGTSKCCSVRYSRQRQTVSGSISFERTYQSRQLGWNLEGLAGSAVDCGVRDLSPPLLILHKETRSNLTLQNFCDKPAFASGFDFLVNVYLRWSVFHQRLLQCTLAEIFRFFEVGQLTFDLCELWEQQEFFETHRAAGMGLGFRSGTPWKRFLRPAYYWTTQLRVAPTSASEPVGTLRPGRVPRGAS